MSRKDKPYLPLYVQDFITDEKLNECSAEAHGVYIRLMCLMHKSEKYGTILLKQKYKQNASKSEAKNKICLDFASQLAKQMPFPVEVIERGLIELVEEGVVYIENDCLVQKRMLNDGLLSSKRAEAGSKGGKSGRFALAKSQANVKQNLSKPLSKTLSKIEANSENEIENEIENDSRGIGVIGERENYIVPRLVGVWMEVFPSYARDDTRDFEAVRKISEFIAGQLRVNLDDTASHEAIVERFKKIAAQVSQDDFWKGKPLFAIEKHIQEFYNKTSPEKAQRPKWKMVL